MTKSRLRRWEFQRFKAGGRARSLHVPIEEDDEYD